MADQYILDVVPTSADRMLVLSCPGNAWEYSCYDSLLLRRFTAHGVLDPDFGAGATWILGADGSASAIAQRPDGSLLVAGRFDDGSGFVAAATASGQRDPVFGGQSVLRLTQPVRALAVQVDGKLLVGTVPDNANFAECPEPGWTLQRLSASVAVDQTFGAGGSVTSLMIDGAEQRNCELTKIWTEPSGDLVLQTAVGLRRLRGDGSLDTTFGSADGVAATHGTVTRTADGGYFDIALRSDRWVAQRFDSDGRNDPTFGSGGRIDLDVPGMLSDFGTIDQQFVERFAAAEDGQHYYASAFVQGRLKSTGEVQSGTFIFRFLADGAVDTAYGDGGRVQMGRAVQLGNRGLFTQSDGKLIVATGGAIYRLLAGDEPSPGIVSAASADPVPVVEGGRARVVVSRTAGDSTAISVRYVISLQDAMPDLDFLPVSGKLSWAAGDDSDRIVEIATIDDSIDESELEFLAFQIIPAEGAPIITYPYAWIPIADNDPPPAAPVLPPATPVPPPATPTAPPQSSSGGGGGAIGVTEAIFLLGLWAAEVLRRRGGRAGARARRSRIPAYAPVSPAAQLLSGSYGSTRGTVHAGNQPLPGDRDHHVLQRSRSATLSNSAGTGRCSRPRVSSAASNHWFERGAGHDGVGDRSKSDAGLPIVAALFGRGMWRGQSAGLRRTRPALDRAAAA
jgi:hypothetical protein